MKFSSIICHGAACQRMAATTVLNGQRIDFFGFAAEFNPIAAISSFGEDHPAINAG
ncbi:Uncharacterised protein [Mycobacteroides abscessus subsp. abscessus]|nr:Uncharacterised protein [Mycobacteroides abscessus subsp. abscessus]